MRTNKDVLVYQKEAGRKVFLVALQLKHEVGALARLTSALEGANYNILSGFVSAPDPDGYGKCSFFLEAAEGRPTAQDLEQVVKASGVVQEVETKEAHDGVILDTLNFPLSWNSGDRVVMLRAQFFATMEAGLRKHFESGADVVLQEMGYHHGKATWEDLLKIHGVGTQADLEELLGFYDANGWGRTEVVTFRPELKIAVVRLRGNFECTTKGVSRPGSHFVRGHLEGLFESVFGGGVQVSETRCMARGAQYCEFTMSPRPEPGS